MYLIDPTRDNRDQSTVTALSLFTLRTATGRNTKATRFASGHIVSKLKYDWGIAV